tara:strand:- start:765 stop:1073 length:309 start_codon:yes stop_codon:yes gene_type:complete
MAEEQRTNGDASMDWLKRNKITTTWIISVAFAAGLLYAVSAQNSAKITEAKMNAITHQIQSDQKFEAINILMRSQAKINGQTDARWEAIQRQLDLIVKAVKK